MGIPRDNAHSRPYHAMDATGFIGLLMFRPIGKLAV
ncbi:hypothetical protein HDE79_002560 [Rhodanobacter sp. MP1X3]|nr:hypothetical protein [Rhodanobacter sp. MP1X3]